MLKILTKAKLHVINAQSKIVAWRHYLKHYGGRRKWELQLAMKLNIKQVSLMMLLLSGSPYAIVCTGLIEDLGSETERVDVKIQRETKRIEKTTRKSGNIGKNRCVYGHQLGSV